MVKIALEIQRSLCWKINQVIFVAKRVNKICNFALNQFFQVILKFIDDDEKNFTS